MDRLSATVDGTESKFDEQWGDRYRYGDFSDRPEPAEAQGGSGGLAPGQAGGPEGDEGGPATDGGAGE